MRRACVCEGGIAITHEPQTVIFQPQQTFKFDKADHG